MEAKVKSTGQIVKVAPIKIGDEVISYSCKLEHTTRVYQPEEISIIDKRG